MKQFVVEINDAEEKALLTDMISIQEYIDNAIHHKASQCINIIVKGISDRQPKKIPIEEKFQMVRDVAVESAAERDARLKVEFLRER